jgi:uncharacterized damage-inducible protein DinB
MQTVEIFRTLIAYEAAQWQRIWQSVETLSAAQAEQELPYSHGSVRNQMHHVTEVLYRWLRGLQGDPNAIHLSLAAESSDSLESLQRTHMALLGELAAWVEARTDAELEQTLPGMRGPVWHVLAHLVNHGTDHRAQVLAALHQLDAPTFAQDLIFTLWFPEPAPWSRPLPDA